MRLWRRRAGDIDEEIEAHLRMAVADRVERGESADEARRAALREFGNVAMVRETTRRMWGWEWLERVGQDLRYAWRQLRRSPGFAATVIVTLAVGLGATAAMFTVVNRVLFQTLPYRDAGRLVVIQEAGRRGAQARVPALDIAAWRARSRSFEQIAFYSSFKNSLGFLEGDAGAEQVDVSLVSANLFEMLGVRPAIGHGFEVRQGSELSEAADAETIVLSDAVWRDQFGGDSKILGRTVQLSGKSYTVVGVMPRGFNFPLQKSSLAMVWTPV